jgi:hypothetical protein
MSLRRARATTSIIPSARSVPVSGVSRWSTQPSSTRVRQVLQNPCRQEYGQTPARCNAGSRVQRSKRHRRPLSGTVPAWTCGHHRELGSVDEVCGGSLWKSG